jgi:hypothetical protein
MLPNGLFPAGPKKQGRSGSASSQYPSREEKSDWKRGIPEQATQFTLDHLGRPQLRTLIDNENFL